MPFTRERIAAPEDMEDMLPSLVAALPDEDEPACTSRLIDSSKIRDHHAILPTHSLPSSALAALPAVERETLRPIVARLLMTVSKPFRYAETTIQTECACREFITKGKTVMAG